MYVDSLMLFNIKIKKLRNDRNLSNLFELNLSVFILHQTIYKEAELRYQNQAHHWMSYIFKGRKAA